MKKTRRFFSSNISGEKVILENDEHNHITNVLRLTVGEDIIVSSIDPHDHNDYFCTITKIDKKQVEAAIVGSARNQSEPKLQLSVFQALCKGEKMELIGQKLNELGVLRFIPFTSQNTTVKSGTSRLDRLEKIASESSKQCGRASYMQVEKTLRFTEVIKNSENFNVKLIAYEGEKNTTLKSVLAPLPHDRRNISIAMIVGSEGGFSAEEVSFAQENGFSAITLGRRIMRAETASIALAAAIMYEMEEWTR